MKLYNTLSRKLEEFKPIKKEVRMYNCGPTVYNYVHIGNLRSFIFSDLLRRYLEYKGYKVNQVMNITDVGHLTSDSDDGEDKLMVAAKKEKKDPYEISKFYTKKFMEDIKTLNILKASKYPKATDHIKEMIEVIKELKKQGYAYESNGNIYFDTSKFKDYGKLSKFKIEELKEGKRVDTDKNKKNSSDFVLWFTESKYKDHLMKWDSPFGTGYPGWHIECTAMSMKYLSDAFKEKFNPKRFKTIDIHTGGEDNMFPHHECEIAQTECATGKKFANFWLHVKHLIIEGNKMSKSKGNFFTLKDLEDKSYDPMSIRYVLMSTHYRQQLNFTLKELEIAKNNLNKIKDFMRRLEESYGKDSADKALEKASNKFEKEMDNDLNISGAFAAIFDLMSDVNKLNLNKESASQVYNLMLDFDSVLGLEIQPQKESINKSIDKLIQEREDARKSKDYKKADEIRDKLKKMNIILEDTTNGVRWKKFS